MSLTAILLRLIPKVVQETKNPRLDYRAGGFVRENTKELIFMFIVESKEMSAFSGVGLHF